MVSIRELATQNAFTGTANHKIAEPMQIRSLPVIDNSVATQSNITTSIDCYVSGQYTQTRNGKVIEVIQRYTIFISYSKMTQTKTMAEVRNRIMQDFESKYGVSFNVTNVHVPMIPLPQEKVVKGVPKGTSKSIEFYEGTKLFRQMTRFERARYEVGTQKEMAKTNISAIKKRYGLRR